MIFSNYVGSSSLLLTNYLFLVRGEWVFCGRHELQTKEKDDGSVAGKHRSILLNM